MKKRLHVNPARLSRWLALVLFLFVAIEPLFAFSIAPKPRMFLPVHPHGTQDPDGLELSVRSEQLSPSSYLHTVAFNSEPEDMRADLRDVNGDGQDDIVWRNSRNGATRVWLMSPIGTVQEELSLEFEGKSAPLNWVIRGVGDMNGDGEADLLWRNVKDGATVVWVMTPQALVSQVIHLTFRGNSPPLDWVIQGVADVNGDGEADVVWRNKKTGLIVVWLMTALATIDEVLPVEVDGRSAPLNWVVRGIGDVNGDNRADLVWRNTIDGATAVWLMTSQATVDDVLLVQFVGRSAPLNWVIKGVADVNGDTRADLVWRNTIDGATVVWLMTTQATVQALVPLQVGGKSAPLNWIIKALGDINGDNRADLVWRNTKDGAIAVWLMTALTTVDEVRLLENDGKSKSLDWLLGVNEAH